jgi:crossover junction endodeoxyribonuclease RusA
VTATPSTPDAVSFAVSGTPVAQGSMVLRRGRVAHASSGRLTQWRHAVAWSARAVMTTQPLGGPVRVVVRFSVPTPATRPPDLDKLTRAILDALTGIVWLDDRQVVSLHATKGQSATPGVAVTVTPCDTTGRAPV